MPSPSPRSPGRPRSSNSPSPIRHPARCGCASSTRPSTRATGSAPTTRRPARPSRATRTCSGRTSPAGWTWSAGAPAVSGWATRCSAGSPTPAWRWRLRRLRIGAPGLADRPGPDRTVPQGRRRTADRRDGRLPDPRRHRCRRGRVPADRRSGGRHRQLPHPARHRPGRPRARRRTRRRTPQDGRPRGHPHPGRLGRTGIAPRGRTGAVPGRGGRPRRPRLRDPGGLRRARRARPGGRRRPHHPWRHRRRREPCAQRRPAPRRLPARPVRPPARRPRGGRDQRGVRRPHRHRTSPGEGPRGTRAEPRGGARGKTVFALGPSGAGHHHR